MPLGKFRNSSTNSTWSRIRRSGCKAKNPRTQTPPPALSVPREKCGLFCCERVEEHGRGLNPAAHQPSQAPWLLEAGAAACLQPSRRGAPEEVKSVVAQPPLTSQARPTGRGSPSRLAFRSPSNQSTLQARHAPRLFPVRLRILAFRKPAGAIVS